MGIPVTTLDLLLSYPLDLLPVGTNAKDPARLLHPPLLVLLKPLASAPQVRDKVSLDVVLEGPQSLARHANLLPLVRCDTVPDIVCKVRVGLNEVRYLELQGLTFEGEMGRGREGVRRRTGCGGGEHVGEGREDREEEEEKDGDDLEKSLSKLLGGCWWWSLLLLLLMVLATSALASATDVEGLEPSRSE